MKLQSSVLACTLLVGASSLFAESLTGVVTNKTTNKPAVGDDVVLIRLQQGMQEASRTKTDSKGRFTLNVPDTEVHLVRVTHDKANYFRPAPSGTQSVEVEVFNAKPKVEGVTQEADVLRLQTDPNGGNLRVVENFFVKNESSPPLTQFSDRPFEFYLPAGAVIEGSAALAPNGMPVQSPPVPLGDSPNHYAFIFPVRPGETRFQLTYHIPYKDSFTFTPRPVLTTDTVAVMMPKSMSFKGGPSTPYNPVADEVNAQTYVARNVQPSQPLEFTVGGTGQLPRDSQAAGPADSAQSAAPGAPQPVGSVTPGQASEQMRSDTKPGRGLGNPLDSDGNLDPWSKYKWWTIGGLGLLLAAAAGILLRGPKSGTGTVTAGSLLAVLRDELFAVETDRLEGRLTESQYEEIKGALDIVLRRALARQSVSISESVSERRARASNPASITSL